ncbi:MAG: endonuclease III [Gammaproteobacteria bacterium]
MNERARYELFARLRAARPNPSTELQFTSAFELLIAVMLSAQATDRSVNKATAELFRHANTPAQMLALGEEGVRRFVRSIGLFNTKTRHIISACRILVDRYSGSVPHDRDALEALPGVGRKTANVILNTAFGVPTIAVDTHIFRVANRTGLATGKTPRQVEEVLYQVVPQEFLKHAHHWLLLHGRYVCTAQKPRCGRCPIRELCEFPDKTPV